MRTFQRLLVAVAALCCVLSGSIALHAVATYEEPTPPSLSAQTWPVFLPGHHEPVAADACPPYLAGRVEDPCQRSYPGDEAAQAALAALWGSGPGPGLGVDP